MDILYRLLGRRTAVKSPGAPTWLLWMSCRTGEMMLLLLAGWMAALAGLAGWRGKGPR